MSNNGFGVISDEIIREVMNNARIKIKDIDKNKNTNQERIQQNETEDFSDLKAPK